MSKAVMLSINPKWCELIASGKKTVEVRKTKPKLDTPFKCYIYETKGKTEIPTFIDEEGHEIYQGRGQVIGEFVCDYIYENISYDSENTCISANELSKYANGKALYGWHISNLVIYDKPKELGEFKKINRECWYADLGLAKRDCPECKNEKCFLAKPPQSWCYVEELSI